MQKLSNSAKYQLENLGSQIWNLLTKLPSNANAPKECLPTEIETTPNKTSQKEYTSVFLPFNKRGKDH